MNTLRLCKFTGTSGYGFIHLHADGTSNVYYAPKPMSEDAASEAMLAHKARHTPTVPEGQEPAGPVIDEPFNLDWAPDPIKNARGSLFQKGFSDEWTAMHVPVITPSDTPKGDAPPKLEDRPLPPV